MLVDSANEVDDLVPQVPGGDARGGRDFDTFHDEDGKAVSVF